MTMVKADNDSIEFGYRAAQSGHMPKRFTKSVLYIGVKSAGMLGATLFWGRPANPSEFDAIFDAPMATMGGIGARIVDAITLEALSKGGRAEWRGCWRDGGTAELVQVRK